MHDGWEYVVACYGIVAISLGAWFWMILAKLRRLALRAAAQERSDG